MEQDLTLATYEDKCVSEIQVGQEAPRILARLQSIYKEGGQHSFQQIIKYIFKLFNLKPTKIYEEMVECKHKRCKGHTNLTRFRQEILKVILNRLLSPNWEEDNVTVPVPEQVTVPLPNPIPAPIPI